MSLAHGAPQRPSTVFALPDTARSELLQLRNQLRLMAHLTAVRTNVNSLDAPFSPDMFAWWFSRLEKDIDGIVAASSFSTQLVKEYEAARKKGTASRPRK